MEESVLFVHGCCEPVDPGGIAVWGFAVVRKAAVLKQAADVACEVFSPSASKDVAEYCGLIEGLRACVDLGLKSIAVKSDSRTLIHHMTGNWVIRSEALRSLKEKVMSLVREFLSVRYVLISPSENWLARSLSRNLLKKILHESDPTHMVFRSGRYTGKTLKEVLCEDPVYARSFLLEGATEKEIVSSWINRILGKP